MPFVYRVANAGALILCLAGFPFLVDIVYCNTIFVAAGGRHVAREERDGRLAREVPKLRIRVEACLGGDGVVLPHYPLPAERHVLELVELCEAGRELNCIETVGRR